jgi:hypothetical protein
MIDKFIWDEALQRGYFPVDDPVSVYNQAYFDKYKGYEVTEVGKNINDFRIEYVNFFTGKDSKVLDIGIGSGFFLSNRENTYGFDVNPVAIEYLKKEGKFLDPYEDDLFDISCVTCFDSFEHIKHPEGLLFKIPYGCYFICSIPIFKNKEHCLASKHFRPDEHFHYFTNAGFVHFMHENKFSLCWVANREIQYGREDIYTYAFHKNRG